MQLDIVLLKQICETPGVPGYEKPIRDLVLATITPFVDEIRVDNLGNVFTLKRGKNNPQGKKAMVAAHMDEIGFMVTHVDDKGFLRFNPLGGFDPKTVVSQRVVVHGKKDLVGVIGTKPIHVMNEEERRAQPKLTNFFVDLGMKKEEVEEWIGVGNPITRQRDMVELGDCVSCKSLDNRISVYVLIETLKKLQNHPYDVYGVFTVQEEVGLRGAQVAAHTLNPDFGFGLDTTIAFDLPGAQPHEQVTALGKGAAIKILDASAICDYRMVAYMRQVAEKSGIKWQHEILTAGGTDTAGVQLRGKTGAIAGAVSIPTRHLHQDIEMVHKEDVLAAIELLKASLEHLDTYDWSH
jgi:endoglucanase